MTDDEKDDASLIVVVDMTNEDDFDLIERVEKELPNYVDPRGQEELRIAATRAVEVVRSALINKILDKKVGEATAALQERLLRDLVAWLKERGSDADPVAKFALERDLDIREP